MSRSRAREWLQVEVALFPSERRDRPYVPWADLLDALADWEDAGRFDRFFFTRKPPGLRLRFGGPDLAGTLEPWLVAAERRNAIRGFRFSPYEPEVHRFGGDAGLAVAHELFHGDSRLALRYEASPPDGEAKTRHHLSLAMTGDLLARSLDDTAEVWDVWKRLEAAVASAAAAPAGAGPPVGPAPPPAPTPPSCADLFGAAQASNQEVATDLRAVVAAGRLTRGIREWLTAATLFQWNRWGLPLELDLLVQEVAATAAAVEPDTPPSPSPSPLPSP